VAGRAVAQRDQPLPRRIFQRAPARARCADPLVAIARARWPRRHHPRRCAALARVLLIELTHNAAAPPGEAASHGLLHTLDRQRAGGPASQGAPSGGPSACGRGGVCAPLAVIADGAARAHAGLVEGPHAEHADKLRVAHDPVCGQAAQRLLLTGRGPRWLGMPTHPSSLPPTLLPSARSAACGRPVRRPTRSGDSAANAGRESTALLHAPFDCRYLIMCDLAAAADMYCDALVGRRLARDPRG